MLSLGVSSRSGSQDRRSDLGAAPRRGMERGPNLRRALSKVSQLLERNSDAGTNLCVRENCDEVHNVEEPMESI